MFVITLYFLGRYVLILNASIEKYCDIVQTLLASKTLDYVGTSCVQKSHSSKCKGAQSTTWPRERSIPL